MCVIKFGPSGNGAAYAEAGFTGSANSAKWVKDMGLDCFEYSFGRGVNLGDETAAAIGKKFRDESVELSVHAPYYINFANPDDEKAANSYGYVLSTLRAAKLMGAKRIVFHPAAQGKLTRSEADELTKKRLETLATLIEDGGYSDMIVCPETMGKQAQIGTVEEIAEFVNIAPFYYPCVDFGHVNAREGGILKRKEDFLKVFDDIERISGKDKLEKLHVHFSKIEYTKKGEVRHLTFEDEVYGPDYKPFLEAVKERGLKPYIICESAGTQDIDAKAMKEYYNSLI